MKRLHFDYYMKISYTIPVSICYFTIKCIPRSNARQKLIDYKIELVPEINYSRDHDSFLNDQIYGCVNVPHDMFSFHISGDVEIGQILYEEMEDENLDMMFGHPYNLNKAGDEIKKYFSSLDILDSMTDYEKSVFIMRQLYKDFEYEKNITDINTTAEEAFVKGKGVCQDYAHIMIALLHLAGIKARYVTGMLVGEGASHAWVEILMDDKWYGLDPSNNKAVSDEHIKIAVGRDAGDCMINRGIMHGGGLHTQTIKVRVTETDGKD